MIRRVTFALGLLISFSAPLQAQRANAVLKGVVSDINESRIQGATVTLASGNTRQTTATREDGTYSFELPLGIYRIDVAAIGFCPARRAAFRVNSLKHIAYNFILIPCPISNDLTIENGRYKGETDRYRNPFKEESFPIKQDKGAPLELLVHYGVRTEDKRSVEYSGALITYYEQVNTPAGYVQRNKSVGVTVTYDQIMIHADQVRLDTRTFRVEAIGNVILEKGNRRTKARKLLLRFSDGKPIVKHTA